MENQIMRRTRSGKLLGSVVTKKTVRETVEVVVTPYDSSAKEVNQSTGVELDVISTSTNENQRLEVISTTPWKSPVRRVTIDYGEKIEDQVMQSPAPPLDEEEERRKELQWRKEEQANEIETQQTRELIQDVEKQKHQEDETPGVGGEVELEKNALSMEGGEDATQPASEAEVPPSPPPPPEEDKVQEEDEDNEEWFDVDDEEPKEPSPLEPAPKKAKQAEKVTEREVTTPPRYEAPQKRDDEETGKTKKRKAASGAANVTEKMKASSGSKTSGGEDVGDVKKKRKKKSRRSRGDIAADYKTYIYRVLKQVHPDLGISSKGMAIVNSFLNEMYEKIGDEAGRLSRYTDAKTLSARDIQDAVRMVLPGDLGKHAIAEGAKAISRYVTYN